VMIPYGLDGSELPKCAAGLVPPIAVDAGELVIY
jgi:hypothetical protein